MVRAAPALRCAGLGLHIGGARILEDIDLQVATGEMLGVIGPNGAGKTTLFNLISGVLRPTAGRIEVDGRDVTDTSAIARAREGLGRTFQTSSVFAHLSVRENVRLAAQAHLAGSLALFRRPRRDDAASEIATARLEEVGLVPRAATLAGQLSHGDKRKLEIALLLAGEPRIILLDEPMAGLATGDVPDLVALIARVHADPDRTILMIEHHLDVLLGLVDRVAVLHHGRLLACDTPGAVVADAQVQAAYLGQTV